MIRLVSAAVLIAVVLTSIWLLPPWTTVILASGVAAAASAEVAGLARRRGGDVPGWFVALAAALVVLSFALPWPASPGGQPGSLAAVLLVLPIAAGLLVLAGGSPDEGAFLRAAVMTMAPVYVGLPLGALASVHWARGPAVTSWLLATIVVSDSAQYYVGRNFGRRKLSPAFSPGKTVEGAIGGLTAAGMAGLFLGPLCLPGLGAWGGALIALTVAVFGLAGDLFESALKRSAGVKDSSGIIPGHGGVLDRIDAYLFASPVFYLLLRYLA